MIGRGAHRRAAVSRADAGEVGTPNDGIAEIGNITNSRVDDGNDDSPATRHVPRIIKTVGAEPIFHAPDGVGLSRNGLPHRERRHRHDGEDSGEKALVSSHAE